MVFMIIFVVPFLLFSFISFVYKKFIVSEVDVKDKIILVTGASSGLGEACAKRYAKAGGKVILCARNVQELNRVKKEINGDETGEWPLIYSLDVTKSEDVTSTVQEIETKYGTIDVLLSNAGVSQRGSVQDSASDVYQNTMKVNYFAQVYLVKAVLPSMLAKRSGHIISVGSVQGLFALPFRSAYSASKHASQAFFDSLRAEVTQDNINVTVVNPGYIKTNLSKNAISGDGTKHGVLDATTASGMSPSFVANTIFDATVSPTNDLFIGDIQSTVAFYLRALVPSVYFKAMEWRAKKQWKSYKKTS